MRRDSQSSSITVTSRGVGAVIAYAGQVRIALLRGVFCFDSHVSAPMRVCTDERARLTTSALSASYIAEDQMNDALQLVERYIRTRSELVDQCRFEIGLIWTLRHAAVIFSPLRFNVIPFKSHAGRPRRLPDRSTC
jgi:hypothetical protein